MLANVFDAVREVGWVTAQANSQRKVRRPKPHPRPERHHGSRVTAEDWKERRAEWLARETSRLKALGEVPPDWPVQDDDDGTVSDGS